MTLLENEAFLAELGKLFERSKGGGPKTLSITMKRCMPGTADWLITCLPPTTYTLSR